jgi:hypothetical protein
VIGQGPLERLSDLQVAAGTTEVEGLTGGHASALGWATVELDRAAFELGQALLIPPEAFVEAPGSFVLGARCRVAVATLPGGISLVLLEPITEGRLASTLARHDEGPAVVWLAVEDLAGAVAVVQTRAGHTSLARPGPFGDECLVLDGPIHGPHRLLVERPGTITS